MSDGRDEVKGGGLKDTAVDEGCNRVMEDQAKWMEGEMESTEPSKPEVFIAGATPNKQMKNQVTYDYRTPTLQNFKLQTSKVNCHIMFNFKLHKFIVYRRSHNKESRLKTQDKVLSSRI
jgi:hypothetical protein